jgi:hypothetical protein
MYDTDGPWADITGWRADKAYEDAQREEFLAWRRSLTWGEWFRVQLDRYWASALGAGSAAFVCWLFLR